MYLSYGKGDLHREGSELAASITKHERKLEYQRGSLMKITIIESSGGHAYFSLSLQKLFRDRILISHVIGGESEINTGLYISKKFSSMIPCKLRVQNRKENVDHNYINYHSKIGLLYSFISAMYTYTKEKC